MRQAFEKQNAKVKFDYAVLRKDDLMKQIKPSDAELKAFYERNQATYNNSIPEKRKLHYVVRTLRRSKRESAYLAEDLQAYYDQHRDEYRVPEQVNVSHILIKTPLPGADGKVDPKGVEEARKKAEDVLKQLKVRRKFCRSGQEILRGSWQWQERRFAGVRRSSAHAMSYRPVAVPDQLGRKSDAWAFLAG